MYRQPPRQLSQRSYQLIQEIHRENERQRQADKGLTYRAHATARRHGATVPLHIGPEIDMENDGKTYRASAA